MKKITMILAAAAFAAAVVACSSGASYTIKANVEDLDGTVYLFDENREVVDSTVASNGAFTFKGDYTVPAMYRISDVKEGRGEFSVSVYIEPGTIYVARAEGEGWDVTGTPSNDANMAFSAEMRSFMDRARAASDEESEALNAEYEAMMQKYFDENRDNYFGANILAQQFSYEYSGQELLDAVNSFPEDVQQGKILVRKRETAEQRIKTDPGNSYIEVSQKDPEGNEILLSSVVENPANKYILVDFWASWCNPCMGEVPYLKAAYDMFHSKGFEIYGISFDTDHNKWVRCIEDRGLNWIHVSDVNRFDNQACRDYAIEAIPSNVLLDGNGTVIAKQLFGDDLYAKLAELLGE